MKKALLLLSLFFNSCIGFIAGDLRSSEIDQALSFHEVSVDYKQDNIHRSYGSGSLHSEYVKQVHIACNQTKKVYQVHYEYAVQGSSISSEIMPYLTFLTLGILPLYSTNNIDLNLKLYDRDKLLFEETIDARAHWYYGWLLLYTLEDRNAENNIKWNEGAMTKGTIYKAAYTRSLGRLHRSLKEKYILSQICPE